MLACSSLHDLLHAVLSGKMQSMLVICVLTIATLHTASQRAWALHLSINFSVACVMYAMCLQVLRVFTWGQKLALGLGLAAALSAAATAVAGQSDSKLSAALVVVAVICTATSWQCSVLRQKFIFVDYVHAER